MHVIWKDLFNMAKDRLIFWQKIDNVLPHNKQFYLVIKTSIVQSTFWHVILYVL